MHSKEKIFKLQFFIFFPLTLVNNNNIEMSFIYARHQLQQQHFARKKKFSKLYFILLPSRSPFNDRRAIETLNDILRSCYCFFTLATSYALRTEIQINVNCAIVNLLLKFTSRYEKKNFILQVQLRFCRLFFDVRREKVRERRELKLGEGL